MAKSKYIKQEEFVEKITELNTMMRKALKRYERIDPKVLQRYCRTNVPAIIKELKGQLRSGIVHNEILIVQAIVEKDEFTYWINNDGFPACRRGRRGKEQDPIGYG